MTLESAVINIIIIGSPEFCILAGPGLEDGREFPVLILNTLDPVPLIHGYPQV